MASSQVPSTDQNAASMSPSSPASTVQSAIATAVASIATPPTRTGTPGTGIASGTTTTAAGAGVVSPSINVTQTYPSSFASITSIANYPTQAINSFETYKKKDSAKIVVRFKAIGNAPIMRNNHFRITAFNRFQAVIQFLRKELGWKQGDALFLYINSSFSPAPDDTVGNLFRCFGTEGHLIVNYSTQAAWG